MSTKRTPNKKQPVDNSKPKYRLSQKVYFADYTNLRPRIFEGKIVSINAVTEMSPTPSTNPPQQYTNFCYSIQTAKGVFDVYQYRTHPSFQAAAIEHGKQIFEAL